MFIKRVFAALLAFGVFSSVSYANIKYECEMSNIDPRSWIPSQVHFIHDDKTNQAIVVDSVILSVLDVEYLPAKVRLNNSKKVGFTWVLPSFIHRGQHVPRFEFRATVNKDTKKIIISAEPARYINKFFGRGTCKMENI